MKRTLSTYEITEALFRDKNANWSLAGARAMAEHLEQLEEDCGEEHEFDYVAVRCDYAQYKSLRQWAKEYFGDSWREDMGFEEDTTAEQEEETIRDFIQDNGALLEFEDGIIVSSF